MQVEQGYVDFIPTPLESRQIISGGYRMPATLLVQFSDDSIDETPQIASALQRPGESGEQANAREHSLTSGFQSCSSATFRETCCAVRERLLS